MFYFICVLSKDKAKLKEDCEGQRDTKKPKMTRKSSNVRPSNNFGMTNDVPEHKM